MGMSLTTPAGRFRIAAIAEAISWAGLLIGMFLKRVLDVTDVGVTVFGPLHGVLFLGYVVVAIATWSILRWNGKVGIVAVLAGIPPFGSVVFERWATHTGHLDDDRAAVAAS